MDYPNIKKHLGEDRLNKELEFLEKEEWLDPQRKSEAWMGYIVFKIVDELIGKNELVTNFNKWAREAKDSKNLKDCLFELSCIDELSKSNKLTIKQKNGNKVPDGFIDNKKIYIEMTNLENIPQSIELKVNDLCEKSQERFGNSLGIHLVGINGFFEYSKEEDKMVPKKELQLLIKDLRNKIQKLDKNILCFILVHSYFAYHPNIKQFRLYREIPHIISNGTADWDLLKDLFPGFKLLRNKKQNI